jgi:hypothetical protein
MSYNVDSMPEVPVDLPQDIPQSSFRGVSRRLTSHFGMGTSRKYSTLHSDPDAHHHAPLNEWLASLQCIFKHQSMVPTHHTDIRTLNLNHSILRLWLIYTVKTLFFVPSHIAAPVDLSSFIFVPPSSDG